MGWRASWIGVRAGHKAAVLEQLGFVETGEVDFGGDAYLTCAELSSGWVIISTGDLDFATPGRMSAVSSNGEAIGCQAWDTITFSGAWGYRNGEQVWSVTHDPEKGVTNLATEGRPPAEFEGIRAKLMSEQAQDEGRHVDHIFEVPIVLTEALCGFRPDEGFVGPETVFKVIEPVRSGGAAKRRAAERALNEKLGTLVQQELYPLAESLGFERVIDHPDFHKFYRRGASNAFVRYRGEWSESLQFFWGFREETPQIAINFFVRRGRQPRYGRSGKAHVSPQPRSMLERFIGRKRDPDDEVRKAIATGQELLFGLDHYLNEGKPHPHIHAPVYWDEGQNSG